MAFFGRFALAIAAFFVLSFIFFVLGFYVYNLAYFEPTSGDPRGRGVEGAVDFLGIGVFVIFFLSAIGAALVVLATFDENRNSEFFITSLAFLIFSAVTVANYMSIDTIFTRDSQAILNICLVGTAVGTIFLLQKYVAKIKILALYVIAVFILFLAVYAFVALPAWYTISFISWKFGAGELESIDGVAKVIGGIGSILAVLGLQWKSGLLGKLA